MRDTRDPYYTTLVVSPSGSLSKPHEHLLNRSRSFYCLWCFAGVLLLIPFAHYEIFRRLRRDTTWEGPFCRNTSPISDMK